jgi:hypothetical protein
LPSSSGTCRTINLVTQELDRGIDLSVLRYSQYQDTALMVALRIYGKMLKTKANANKSKGGASILTASLIGLIGGSCFYYFYKKPIYSFIVASSLFSATVLAASLLRQAHAAKIIKILIDADPDINTRNKEGLSAAGILQAYFPYDHQLNGEEKEILALILQKSLNSPTTIVLQTVTEEETGN